MSAELCCRFSDARMAVKLMTTSSEHNIMHSVIIISFYSVGTGQEYYDLVSSSYLHNSSKYASSVCPFEAIFFSANKSLLCCFYLFIVFAILSCINSLHSQTNR